MTWDQALEIVIARTGHARYRQLCDASHESHVAYRDLMLKLAATPSLVSPAPSPIPLEASVRATRLGFARCWFSERDARCGCSGLSCHLLGRIVTLEDCVRCLS